MGKEDGERWTGPDGTVHTVNSTDDPGAPGGVYHTQVDKDGNKSTAVYDPDGKLADVKSNKSWK